MRRVVGPALCRPLDRRIKLTKVTIIIHEGRGGRGPAGRMGHGSSHHGRRHAGCGAAEKTEERGGRRGHHHTGRATTEGPGHRHEHGRRHAGCGDTAEQTKARGGHQGADGPRHDHEQSRLALAPHGAGRGMGHGPHHPHQEMDSAADEQRQLARRLRRQMRRIMREAEEAGLSPERVERIIKRETRQAYL